VTFFDSLVVFLLGGALGVILNGFFMELNEVQPLLEELFETRKDLVQKAPPVTCECEECGKDLVKIFEEVPVREFRSTLKRVPDLVWVHRDTGGSRAGLRQRASAKEEANSARVVHSQVRGLLSRDDC
jgi:hypothetical protein